MYRSYSKKLFFKIFFPEYLQKTWAEVYDKKYKEYKKWNHDTHPHVEKIEERSDKSSQSKCSAITHKYFGGVDIVKHKCYKHSDNYSNQCCSDIGLIEKQHDGKYKEDDGHQSACESIQSISDIYSIDDRDSDEEGEYRI